MTVSLGKKLPTLLLAIGFLALAAIVAATFWLNELARSNFNQVISARTVRAAAIELRSALQTAEASQRGYLYTNNEIYLGPFDASKINARKHLVALLDGLVDYPNFAEASVRLRATVEQKISEMDESILLKRNREDARARALVETNRGKALMDEANVFLSGMIRAIDQRLIEDASEQQSNTSLLRWVSIVGALAILSVAAFMTYLVLGYTQGLAAARHEVLQLNSELEQRVKDRTAELELANNEVRIARDRAETLLVEVNHRIANSLTMISAIVNMQANAVADKAAKTALAQTNARIHAMSLVHRNLYSAGNANLVDLDKYLGDLIKQLQESIIDQKEGISIVYSLDRVQLPISSSISLGVIVNEWISNALKYAYPSGKGEIRVQLRVLGPDKAELTVSDDGKGLSEKSAASGTGFGGKIVRAMAHSLGATDEYPTAVRGTTARLTFAPHDNALGEGAANQNTNDG